jgi:hypothetical protein
MQLNFQSCNLVSHLKSLLLTEIIIQIQQETYRLEFRIYLTMSSATQTEIWIMHSYSHACILRMMQNYASYSSLTKTNCASEWPVLEAQATVMRRRSTSEFKWASNH